MFHLFQTLSDTKSVLFLNASLLLVYLLFACLAPRRISPWLRRLTRLPAAVRRFAYRGSAVAHASLIVFFALLIGLLSVLAYGIPVPFVHDELSYTLAADTFAGGDLSKPTHPFWRHFITFHVMQQPSYASKYPPGQALTMAFGKLLTGYEIAGVVLTIALACAATYWAMRAWMPRRWALLGGLITAFHPVIFFWSNNYMGGGVALLGGALLLGGARRLATARPRVVDAFLAGVGIGILANSRPGEGFLFTVLLGVLLLAWLWRHRLHAPFATWARATLPGLLVPLLATVVWMGIYNRAVTGKVTELPYMAYTRQFDNLPLFIFQWKGSLLPQSYPNEQMRRFYEDEEAQKFRSRFLSEDGRLSEKFLIRYVPYQVRENLGILFSLPLLLVGFAVAVAQALRRRLDMWSVGGLVVAGVFTCILAGETYAATHYTAPAAALLLTLSLTGLRHLSLLRLPGKVRAGRLLTRFVVPVTCAATLLASGVSRYYHNPHIPENWHFQRRAVGKRLEQEGGRHLIFVRYGSQHTPYQEWVSNRADIDAAPLVWARELSEEENRKLAAYFEGRRVWLVDVDNPQGPLLTPYPEGRANARP